MRPETIHGKKLALLLLSEGEVGFEESSCVTGTTDWDGERLRVRFEGESASFPLPFDKLDRVRAVPPELRRELGEADLYVTLKVGFDEDDVHDARPALGLSWPE
jgi:hypothetical protein